MRPSEAFAQHLFWLGMFAPRTHGLCDGCRLRKIARCCVWLFHGEIAMLHLCSICITHATGGDAEHPRPSELSTHEHVARAT